MGRSRKCLHQLPSVIDTNMDHSSHHDGGSLDSQSDSSIVSTNLSISTVPVIGIWSYLFLSIEYIYQL